VVSFLLAFPSKSCVHSHFPLMRAACSEHLVLFCLIILIIFGEDYMIWSSSLCSFLHPSIISSIFGPNILLSTHEARNEREKLTTCFYAGGFFLRFWRWRRHVPPKCRLTFDGLSQNRELFITTMSELQILHNLGCFCVFQIKKLEMKVGKFNNMCGPIEGGPI
jgi:hypothetical protein